jgi:hypothetical protein
MPVISLVCALLTYGGVSLFVVVFAVYPFAAETLFCPISRVTALTIDRENPENSINFPKTAPSNLWRGFAIRGGICGLSLRR